MIQYIVIHTKYCLYLVDIAQYMFYFIFIKFLLSQYFIFSFIFLNKRRIKKFSRELLVLKV